MFTDCDGCLWGRLCLQSDAINRVKNNNSGSPTGSHLPKNVPLCFFASLQIFSLSAHPSCPFPPAFNTCMFVFSFSTFFLTSLFFLSCFLEPWWCWSGEAEAQLVLHHWEETDTNSEGNERKQKKVLKLSHIYQLWHPLPFFLGGCGGDLHGCHGLTDLCPRHYLNWQSWTWFLETHQNLESVVALRQIIVKKKNVQNMWLKAAKRRCQEARDVGVMRNKWTKKPLSWTKMHDEMV